MCLFKDDCKDQPKPISKSQTLNYVKLIFSSLFGRKMTSCIIGAEDDKENVLYFSNIDLDGIEVYDHDAEVYIHQVTLFDEHMLKSVFEVFPLFKSHVLYINTSDFISALNKLKEDFVLTSNVNGVVTLQNTTECYEVGYIISMYTARLYRNLHQHNKITEHNYWEKKVISDDLLLDGLNILSVSTADDNTITTKVVMNPCFNTVCLKEYTNKFKSKDWLLILRTSGKKSIKFECIFEGTNIRVSSIQPGVRYYCK